MSRKYPHRQAGRKRSARRSGPVSAPMLVSRGINAESLEIQELMLIEAFVGGWATTTHFDTLVDMRNVLTLASAYKVDDSAKSICDAMRIPLANLRERYAKTGRMGVTGEELQLLRAFVSFYGDFWLRQPLALYEAACAELGKHNESLKVAA